MAFTEIEVEKEGEEEIFTKSLSKLNNKMKTIPNKSNLTHSISVTTVTLSVPEGFSITKKYECVTAKETKYILEVATQKYRFLWNVLSISKMFMVKW